MKIRTNNRNKIRYYHDRQGRYEALPRFSRTERGMSDYLIYSNIFRNPSDMKRGITKDIQTRDRCGMIIMHSCDRKWKETA